MKVAAKTPRSNCVMDSSKLASVGIRLTEVHAAVESPPTKQSVSDET